MILNWTDLICQNVLTTFTKSNEIDEKYVEIRARCADIYPKGKTKIFKTNGFYIAIILI
jgi:hypothetical protein